MFKSILFCFLSFSLTTISCVPVQLVEREENYDPDPIEIVIVEQPIIICPPPWPRPPGPKPPIERPAIDKPEKVDSNHKKRPTTPLLPTRPIRKNPAEQSNQKKGKNKSVVNKKQRGR